MKVLKIVGLVKFFKSQLYLKANNFLKMLKFKKCILDHNDISSLLYEMLFIYIFGQDVHSLGFYRNIRFI